jgi:hypothetical protein
MGWDIPLDEPDPDDVEPDVPGTDEPDSDEPEGYVKPLTSATSPRASTTRSHPGGRIRAAQDNRWDRG